MTDGMDSYIEAIFDDRICAEPTDPLNVCLHRHHEYLIGLCSTTPNF